MGSYVMICDIEGAAQELGLFCTTLTTSDKVKASKSVILTKIAYVRSRNV